MKKTTKLTAIFLASLAFSATILSNVTTAYANTTINNKSPKTVSASDIPDIHLSELTPEQNRQLNMMFIIGEELSLTDKGELYLKQDIEFIKTNYKLSDDDITFITSSIANYNKALTEPVYMTRASFEGGYIHLTYDEVLNIVNLAASYGPGVIAGMMSALLSFYPGIGTVVGGIVGWFGAAAILQAMSDAAFNKRGIKIGIGGISAE